MLLTSTVSGDVISLLLTLVVIVVAYTKWTYQYWKRRNLPYLEANSSLGSLHSIFGEKEHVGVKVKRLYEEMRRKGWKHGGIYGLLTPLYLVADLDFLKNIMAKDFQYFSDRGIFHNEKADPISAHLFNIGGVKWRNLRTKLTPTFTSGKMKIMFQTLVDCEVNLQKQIKNHCENKTPVDIKEVLGCFTTDIIGSCAFGLDFNTFDEPNSPFRIYGKRVFERSRARQLKRMFITLFPNISRFLNLANHPKDVRNFFMTLVKDTVEYREKNNVDRKDFMQMLIEMKNNKLEDAEHKHDGSSLTIEEIAAQSFVFFIAGFETSSSAMTFAMYELARNQDIQNRAREEIEQILAKYDGRITYDAIQEMKYLSQVIDEALRMYSPAALLPRRCVKDYKIPGTDTILQKDKIVLIPILGIHYDPEYYPDPEKFDPDRFSEENKRNRHPYAHLPFGEGPRNCIGMRFGLMQSKVGLVSLLRSFRFTVNSKTKEPLKFKPRSLVLAAQGEIWLNAEEI